MSPWIFYLLIALAIVLLMVILALVMRARFMAKQILTDLLAVLRRRKKVKDFWGGLEQLLGELYTHRAGRYDTPWMMLLGEPDSGRSELARALALGDKTHPMLKLINRSGTKDAWQILEHGIIIDGQFLGENKQGIKTLLQEINQIRPERPLDGVIVTLSAETLLTEGRTRLRTQARYIHSLLWLLQKELEFVLPIYIVITKTDRISGYREFWRQFPQFQQQMFGWSSPYHLEAKFEKHWIKIGLEDIVQQLYRLQASALAKLDKDALTLTEARDFILFPQRLAKLQENLGWTLEQVFDDIIFSSGASVRGFYFTGRIDESRAPGGIKELIEQKCFAEKNLAKPLRFALWSRSLRLHKTQRFVCYGLGVLFLSLVYSFFDLKQQVDLQLEAVKILQVYSSYAEDLDDCISADDYFRLLNPISKIHAKVTYWNIPYSWRESRISTRPLDTIANEAFGGVILPAFKCWLENKADNLVASDKNPLMVDDGKVNAAVFNYALEVLAFEYHESLFREITHTNNRAQSREVLEAFHKLTQYLYNRQLPDSLITNNSALLKALLQVNYKERVKKPEGYHQIVDSRLRAGAENLRLSLTDAVGRGEILLDKFARPDSVTRADVDDLLAWSRRVEEAWSGATEADNPCAKIFVRVDALLKSLKKYDEHDISDLEAVVQDFTPDNCYTPLKNQLLGLRSVESVPLMEETAHGLVWTERYQRNLQQLEALTTREFMIDHPASFSNCDQPATINQAALIQSLKSLQSYQEFIAPAPLEKLSGAQTVSDKLLADNFINAVARSQVKSLVNYQMANAIQSIGFTVTQQQLIEKVSFSYNQSINELIALVRLYQQLMFDSSDATWYDCLSNIANEQINEITHLYLSSSVFLPKLASPNKPFLYTNMDDVPEVTDFLNAEQLSAMRLLQYARPYTRWFNEAASLHKAAGNAQVFFWTNSVNEYDNFTRFNDKNSKLGQLRDYYTSHFAGVTTETCYQETFDAGSSGNDLFSERKKLAVNDLANVCADTTAQYVAKDYQELADAFNRQLAGRYPFANTGAQDLDPQSWVNFDASYGPLITALDQHLTQQEEGDRWFSVKQFIAELKGIREHLNLFYPKGLPSSVRISVQFRQNPDNSPGIEQIVQWVMKTPAMQSSFPNQVNDLEWLSGQSLQVSMAWAELSRYTPVRDPSQRHMMVQRNAVTFQQNGPWALHRLVDQQRDGIASDPAVIPLRFTIPVSEKKSTAKTTNDKTSTGQPSETIQLNEVNAQVTLRLSIKGETAQWQAWPMPVDFPQQAPAI